MYFQIIFSFILRSHFLEHFWYIYVNMTTSFTHNFLGVVSRHVSVAYFNQFPSGYMGNEYSPPDKHKQQTNEVLSCWTVVEQSVKKFSLFSNLKAADVERWWRPQLVQKGTTKAMFWLQMLLLALRFLVFPENLVKAFLNQRSKCHNMTWLHLPVKLMMR